MESQFDYCGEMWLTSRNEMSEIHLDLGKQASPVQKITNFVLMTLGESAVYGNSKKSHVYLQWKTECLFEV